MSIRVAEGLSSDRSYRALTDRMDITVLAYLEPDEKEPDVAVQQVADGLIESGHKASILTIRHDVEELIRGLKARKPELVFNLVESFGDDIIGGADGRRRRARPLAASLHGRRAGRDLTCRKTRRWRKSCWPIEGVLYPDFATFAGRRRTSRRAATCGCRCSSSRCAWMPRSASTSARSSATRRS